MDSPAPVANTDVEAPVEEAPESKYWAAAKPENIGKKLRARLDECQQALQGSSHLSHVATAYTHYFGQDVEGVGADASQVTRSGEQGELAEVRAPYCRSLAAGVLNIVTGAKVSWAATAVNNDSKSRAACVESTGALEYYWKDRGVFAAAVQAALEAIIFAEGALFVPWDTSLGKEVVAHEGRIHHEGDVAFHGVPTWDIIRDPTYKGWKQLPWVAVVLWQNKYDVAAEHPKQADSVLKMSADPGGLRWRPFGNTFGATSLTPDCIPVTYWFHKRTPAMQHGRQVVLLEDGTVVSDEPLHESYWKELPVHRIHAGELIGTPFPDTSFWAALGVGQVADSLHTSLTSNITSTAPGLISAEEGSELAPDDLAGGPKILYRKVGSPAPQAVSLQQASPDQFKYLDVLRREAQQLCGLNSTSMGEPESKNLSGAAMAVLSSMSIQNNSNLQGNWVDFVIRLGNAVLAHFQTRLTAPRKIAISGRGRSSLVKAVELSTEGLAAVDRVMVEIGNPLQQTAAGRLELAQLFLSIPGLIQTPEQIQGLVDSGRMDPMTESLSNQLLMVAQENEALADSKEVPVMLTDNHRLHIKEHPAVGASMEARENPGVMKALQGHIAEHIRVLRETDPGILMALGQQPIPPPMQPGMPPPGAGPPPGPPPPGGPPAPEGAGIAPPPAPGDAPADMPSMPTDPRSGQPFVPGQAPPPQ